MKHHFKTPISGITCPDLTKLSRTQLEAFAGQVFMWLYTSEYQAHVRAEDAKAEEERRKMDLLCDALCGNILLQSPYSY